MGHNSSPRMRGWRGSAVVVLLWGAALIVGCSSGSGDDGGGSGVGGGAGNAGNAGSAGSAGSGGASDRCAEAPASYTPPPPSTGYGALTVAYPTENPYSWEKAILG